MWDADSDRTRPTGVARNLRNSSLDSAHDRFLLQMVDAGLAGIIFLAPLVMGGRSPIGQFVFVLLVCLTVVAWLCRQCLIGEAIWRWSGAEALIGLAALLVFFQLAPLSPSLFARLSPGFDELLPTWTSHAEARTGLGIWSTISLTPAATRGGLMIFLSYAMLFLVVVQRVQQVADVNRLLRWIALAATGMAALGIAQQFLGNGKFLWFYEHPFRHTNNAVKGTFINENHFAHFLALGVAPLIWWLQSSLSRDGHGIGATVRGKPRHRERTGSSLRNGQPKLALALALGLVALAGLLTFSRGGVIVMFLAAAMSIAFYARAGLLRGSVIVTFFGVAACVGAAMTIYGSAPLTDELASLSEGTIDAVDIDGLRRKLWVADLAAIADFPWLGTGVGSHSEIYPTYFNQPCPVELTHAENGYLQIWLETGTAGLLLLLSGIGLTAYWCLSSLRRSESTADAACAMAITVGLVISGIHSLWDFAWYIPACMSLTVILIACICRLHQLSRSPDNDRMATQVPISRLASCLTFGVAIVLVAIMIGDRLGPARAAPHWDRYLRQTVALRTHHAGTKPPLETMIRNLERTLHADPTHVRAHARLGNLYLQHFDQQQNAAVNPLPLAQVREAAWASQFQSRDAQDQWLSVALGGNRRYLDLALFHATRALQLCPLQANSYLDVAEVAFLNGHQEATRAAYVEQAIKVRPHSGDVLLAAGSALALAGDAPRAFKLWQAAIQQDPRLEGRLIALMGSMMPVDEFLATFQPKLNGLRSLCRHHRDAGDEQQARIAASHLVQALEHAARAEEGSPAAAHWEQAADLHSSLGDESAALIALEHAASALPDKYQLRYRLANQLLKQGEFDRALVEFTWCERRRPTDPQLFESLARLRERTARRTRMQDATQPALQKL